MGTSDGITTEDWDIVHEIAVEIVNAPDSEKQHHAEELLRYLEVLEAKYGPLPSILATRADYLADEDPAREELLLRAHALADARNDSGSVVCSAQSLAKLYLHKRDLTEANRWLNRMRECLVPRNDADHSEYERIRAEYRKLAIKLTPPSNR
jgi:hypothetical protein